MHLVDALDNSISKLQRFPYAYNFYQAVESLEAKYRILPVKNYLVFYVVTEHAVEIHRIVYAKRNLPKIISPIIDMKL
ncbi:MAG TPA: type II toxin-antitoxin system RelE/ParE family toxin [Candidatus Avamphibacillus sp.]|nr:type II toxin-antitoxin system RelE/ParE family toxin [Candidatus Avamphibacillus sp.]